MLPVLFALYPPCLAGIALVWLYRTKRQTLSPWVVCTLACGSIVVFVFLTGPWAFTSYYLRYVVLGLYGCVAIASYRRVQRLESRNAGEKGSRPVAAPAVFLLFSVLNAFAIASYDEPSAAFDVAFPLSSGKYYVLQGGSNIVTNPFHVLSGSKFAVDIVKLGVLGNRADGVAPRTLSAYQIFGDALHSPCMGSVLAVSNDVPDNAPGETDTDHPEGNYVVLECAGVQIFMAHLMRDSIRVRPGEAVMTGQPIGRIGNSGNTLEPHLHIGAKKGEADIPLKFNRRWLSVNSLVDNVR